MTENNNVTRHDQPYENQYGQQSYMPNNYNYREYTDSFYDEEDSAAGSFVCGAIVGGIIGAAAALFLAPKTGKEMRDDFSSQAGQWKDKSIELSSVAKEKATELTAVAKDKTDEVAKTIQEQSGQLVDKVKSMRAQPAPMDDGTVSSEGEEATEFVQKVAAKTKDKIDDSTEAVTATAQAFKEAVSGEEAKS